MDHDLLALRLADDVIDDAKTRSAILPRVNEGSAGRVVNAMIMAKVQSPFLQRWMRKYGTFDPGEWDISSGVVPKEMYHAGLPDFTLLDSSAWLYPEDHLRERSSWDVRQPYLTKMWTGKSWHDIDRSYGVHFWAFQVEGGSKQPFGVDLSPHMVRNIDTPLFCRMRKLFDNVDGDGYFSTPWGKISELYCFVGAGFEGDDPQTICELSFQGRHLGAQFNTSINATETTVVKRRIAPGSQTFLPVPADWDSRVSTVRMTFQPDNPIWSDGWKEIETGLLKIRMNYPSEIVLSLTSDALGLPQLKFE